MRITTDDNKTKYLVFFIDLELCERYDENF